MTPSDRLDRAEKALDEAVRLLTRAQTVPEIRRAEGLLLDAARELREAECDLAQATIADLRRQAALPTRFSTRLRDAVLRLMVSAETRDCMADKGEAERHERWVQRVERDRALVEAEVAREVRRGGGRS
jgi:hypothetical protein